MPPFVFSLAKEFDKPITILWFLKEEDFFQEIENKCANIIPVFLNQREDSKMGKVKYIQINDTVIHIDEVFDLNYKYHSSYKKNKKHRNKSAKDYWNYMMKRHGRETNDWKNLKPLV